MNYIPVVITSINPPTVAVKKFASFKNIKLIVIGDLKSPKNYYQKNCQFYSIDDQKKLNFNCEKFIPVNHYSRKNLGYLIAMKLFPKFIYETDDDNIPYHNWKVFSFISKKKFTLIKSNENFHNIYKNFTNKFIWPRGYPLDRISNKNKPYYQKVNVEISIWQGLANRNPDVDSIYRFINKDDIFFKNRNYILDNNLYCPFNSQNTTWSKDVFLTMYLPTTVPFRFTDILRSYIAQRIFKDKGFFLGFHKPTVYQVRNFHDNYSDFKDEISMFLDTNKIIKILDETDIKNLDISNSMKKIYSSLYRNKIVKKDEIKILNNWLLDASLI